jgi:hypothetical protein
VASLKDVEQVANDLEALVGELRTELKNGPDFTKLVTISDEISERADNAAQTFNSIDEALSSRLSEVTGRKRSASSSSGGQSREKSQASTS